MLNSIEHEILNAHTCKKYREIQLFSGSDQPRIQFFLLINVKMPTVVGILTFMGRKKSCSVELSMKKVLEPLDLVLEHRMEHGNEHMILLQHLLELLAVVVENESRLRVFPYKTLYTVELQWLEHL